MQYILAFAFLVVANVAITATASAATVTLDFSLYWDDQSNASGLSDRTVIRLWIDGTAVTYEPWQGCTAGPSPYDRNDYWVHCIPVSEGANIELINGNLYTADDLTTATVTVSEPAEEPDCNLSSEDALNTWLSYFFLSWGIMIPIFFAAYAVGMLVRVIRGSR